MKKLAKIYEHLLYILPAVLFCSYYPVISLGTTASMNLELSLPLIWLVLFDLISLILLFIIIKPGKNYPGITDRKFFLLSLFPFFATISIFWSPNPLRATLTAGIIWLLFFAIFSLIFLAPKILGNHRKIRPTFLKICQISTIIICAWCWLQCLLDVFGVSRQITLMCLGCTSTAFGFPHPNGFAIEPQFMGNLLLAPALYSLYQLLHDFSKPKLAFSLFTVATLFLTFSRGAIYAFAVAAIFLIIITIIQQKTARPLLTIIPLVASFLFTLNAQGVFSALSVTDDTYCSGIAKSISHLSLGLIDFTERPTDLSAYQTSENSPSETTKISSTFDGYVEESTTIRLDLTAAALTVWRQNPATILIGTGLGGAGTALYSAGLTGSPKEIVQNQYASLLLETGLVGIATIIIAVVIILGAVKNSTHTSLITAILLAYALALFFFAGLPNALHVYLAPSLFLSKHKFVIE